MRRLIFVLVVLLILGIIFRSLKSSLTKLSTTIITNSSIIKPTATTIKRPPVQEQRPTIIYQNQQNEEQTEEEIASSAKIPASDHMSTPKELFDAVNVYRQEHGLPPLSTKKY